MSKWINLGKAAPELYKAVAALDEMALQRAKSAGIPEGFCDLLKLRASQVNQCPFCVRVHTRDASRHGESPTRIGMVATWRDTQSFTDKERAAFELVEAITLIPGEVPSAIHSPAIALLSAAEIAAVEWLSVVAAAWSRIATPKRYSVGDQMLTMIMVYWITQNQGTSARYYFETAQSSHSKPVVDAPIGVSILTRLREFLRALS
jgi:AhpD family alkylhydroperoxidase